MSKKKTDKERLDWLDNHCDFGRIRLDPFSSKNTPFIVWNRWEARTIDKTAQPSNVREAIDKAMSDNEARTREFFEEQDRRFREANIL